MPFHLYGPSAGPVAPARRVASVLMSTREVAELLGCSPWTVRRYVKAGAMPAPLSVGGRPRWRRSDLESWVEAGCPLAWPDAEEVLPSEPVAVAEEVSR